MHSVKQTTSRGLKAGGTPPAEEKARVGAVVARAFLEGKTAFGCSKDAAVSPSGQDTVCGRLILQGEPHDPMQLLELIAVQATIPRHS